MSMLGRFLEIGLSCEDLLKAISVFEDLDFQPFTVNDIWSHLYGVMGDGDLHVGLHQNEVESPRLTFVRPNLADNVPALREFGIAFEYRHLADSEFHHAAFLDRSGLLVVLQEARTFSPAPVGEDKRSALGCFQHLLLPARDDNDEFWRELLDPQADDNDMLIKTSESVEHLTVVYQTDLESLIVRGAREGWKNFSVTQDHHGLIKTTFGFDFLIMDAHCDD